MDAITESEILALHALGQRHEWYEGNLFPGIGVLELERLDRRGWLKACQTTENEQADGTIQSEPVGGWFQPTQNEIIDGRYDWAAILHSFHQVAWGIDDHLIGYLKLTAEGKEASMKLTVKDAVTLNPIGEVAESLERIAAEWRFGDEKLKSWARMGMSYTSGFPHPINDDARNPVRRILNELRTRLIPEIINSIDPALRDDLRDLVSTLNPDEEGENRYGETDTRWRHYWDGLFYHLRIEEMVALLRAAAKNHREADNGVGKKRAITVEQARQKAEAIVKKTSWPFSRKKPSKNAMANKIGCSPSTLNKAIAVSAKLREAFARAEGLAGDPGRDAELHKLIAEQEREQKNRFA